MTAMFQGKPLFGPQGEPGATFTPSVSTEGVISWTNDGGLPNPEPVSIKGPQGKPGQQGPVGPQGVQGLKGEDASNVYSIKETVIGTWIDGKPLYRKVIQWTTGANIDADELMDVSSLNIDKMVSLTGVVTRENEVDICVPALWIIDGFVRYAGLLYDFTSKMIFERHTYKKYSSCPIIMTLEYTKTTDIAPASQLNLLTSEVSSPETSLSVSYAPASASSAKLDSGGDNA